MADSEIALPQKTREQQWVVWDSTRLNDFKFRPDDIMICTWSKSGTTWMQQIVAQLVLNGDPEAYGQALSPWPEFRLLPKEQWFAIAEAQTHRRFIKSHSPLHAIPFRADVKYIYVGRDVRDVIWSMYHHQSSFTPQAYQAFNTVPGRVGPPLEPPNCDVRAYYHSFLEKNATPGMMTDTEFWANVQEFWNIRHLPNVLLVHYADLKANFKGEVARIAKFLGIEVSAELWPKIIEHCGMEHMRKLGRNVESVSMLFDGGIDTFIHKGTNGRWKDVLSPEEIALADTVAAKNLTPDCARWLKTGQLPRGEK
ncbi:MAG: sulfotransferase domain-containing protein [Alphaproteobacteria bacterium]